MPVLAAVVFLTIVMNVLQLQLPVRHAITLDLIDAPGPTAPPPSPVVLPTELELTGGAQASIHE